MIRLAPTLLALVILAGGIVASRPVPERIAPAADDPANAASAGLEGHGVAPTLAPGPFESATIPDSILDELNAGRYWHAVRMLRAAGAADGTPAEVLLLAEAEAGWNHWPAVLELLRDADWLDQEGAGRGVYLLGRALESAGQWEDAARSYERFATTAGVEPGLGAAALSRRARMAWLQGDLEATLGTLDRLGEWPQLRGWTAVDLAEGGAEQGDTALVAGVLSRVTAPDVASVAWRMQADARLNAGDSAGAAAAFRALADASEGSRAAEAGVELGLLLLADGDSAAARPLLLAALDEAPRRSAERAAAALADLGGGGFSLNRQLARMLDQAGDGRRALRSYDRAFALAREAGEPLDESLRLARARLMATVRDRQEEALEEYRSIHESTEDPDIGARNLQLWAELRARQGLRPQVATLREWLVEEYPASSQAAEVVFMDGFDAEENGRLDRALERYAFVAEHAPTHERAGQARMRAGQIHLGRSELSEAAEVFEAYLDDFPEGRRWQEAAFWAGRTRLELGDSADARTLLGSLTREPFSYYAVVAAELMDEPYQIDVPAGAPPMVPPWMEEGLARLDLLMEAGLERGAEAEVDRMRERADGSREETLGLAGSLIDRGRTVDGINLGWAVRDDGHPWDQEILRVIYPFPYRELVRREAAEWGVDPIVVAALIRQESAFKADIVSGAGAIGLMQVMPPTGAQLARAHGPEGFSDVSLTAPEVNLHLGTAFFVEMNGRYDSDLPLVLSAYNAGPTRANRWRRYPEISDPRRFTEAIPFAETRGYVKNVRRNIGVYRLLYGQQ